LGRDECNTYFVLAYWALQKQWCHQCSWCNNVDASILQNTTYSIPAISIANEAISAGPWVSSHTEHESFTLALSIIGNALGQEIARKSFAHKGKLTMERYYEALEPVDRLVDWADDVGPFARSIASAAMHHARRYMDFKHDAHAAHRSVPTPIWY
jgi:hypothetical protein